MVVPQELKREDIRINGKDTVTYPLSLDGLSRRGDEKIGRKRLKIDKVGIRVPGFRRQ